VLLTWDADSLVLLNRSEAPVDVSGLEFVQVTSAGRELSFSSERWEGGGSPTWALPSGDCFQVWRDTVTGTLPTPEGCDSRRAWQMVGSQRWFWVSDDADASFEVRRGNEALAVCAISAGECPLDLDGDEAALPAEIANAAGQIETDASTSGTASLVLIYDANTLVLFNGTGETVNVSGLEFVQNTADGRQLSFPSDRWDGSDTLPPAGCFQVWRDSLTDLPQPDYCDSRLSWQMVSSPRWFWVSDDPNATFQVRRGDAVLATCRVGDGQCRLDLNGGSVSV
jgi:hypothetical protein